MAGGRASRDKGARTERAIVRVLQEHGLAGERVPLSGSAGGRFGGDISVPGLGRDLRGEAKCRGNGFNRLYEWLDDRDFLVLRADRKPLLVVVMLELATQILAMAERTKLTPYAIEQLRAQAERDAHRIGSLEFALCNIRDDVVPGGVDAEVYAGTVLANGSAP